MFDSFWHPAQASIPGNYVRYIWGTGRAAVFDCRKSPLDSKCNLRDGGMHVFRRQVLRIVACMYRPEIMARWFVGQD